MFGSVFDNMFEPELPMATENEECSNQPPYIRSSEFYGGC
jgi:hypothetical protein